MTFYAHRIGLREYVWPAEGLIWGLTPSAMENWQRTFNAGWEERNGDGDIGGNSL
jgi:hypothetical protein